MYVAHEIEVEFYFEKGHLSVKNLTLGSQEAVHSVSICMYTCKSRLFGIPQKGWLSCRGIVKHAAMWSSLPCFACCTCHVIAYI